MRPEYFIGTLLIRKKCQRRSYGIKSHLFQQTNYLLRQSSVRHAGLISALHIAMNHAASPWAKCLEGQASLAETGRRKGGNFVHAVFSIQEEVF